MSKSNPTGKSRIVKCTPYYFTNLVYIFSEEIAKLQQRLSLLREEYVKLQKHCESIEKDRSIVLAKLATSGIQNGDHDDNDSFVANILKSVASMLRNKEYRYVFTVWTY